MLKLVITGAGFIALASTAAVADPAAHEIHPTGHESASSGTDAVIAPTDVTTREDAKLLAEREFKLADSNADGAIDEAEFAAFAATASKTSGVAPEKAQPADAVFEALAKQDKKITKPELADARDRSFEAADANRDKRLDALEQQKFAALIAVRPADVRNAQ